MKHILITLAITAFLVFSASHILLWKDRQEMWNILDMQIQMLNGIIGGARDV